jgi:hypothetical protein
LPLAGLRDRAQTSDRKWLPAWPALRPVPAAGVSLALMMLKKELNEPLKNSFIRMKSATLFFYHELAVTFL